MAWAGQHYREQTTVVADFFSCQVLQDFPVQGEKEQSGISNVPDSVHSGSNDIFIPE
jgi:hypothetical protein